MARPLVPLVAATVIGLALAVPVAAQSTMFPQSVASGDPRPDSVILWTRLADPDLPDALVVEVATDSQFADVVFTQQLEAEAQYDHCVKVRVDGLTPYTTYYYRFVYGSGAAMEVSPVGRTRTAPAPDSGVPIRFAVVYCQDYIGRFYNAYLKMLLDHDEDVDFVVFLGDYVYETTGNPLDQYPASDRRVEFEDTEGAITLGAPEAPYYAAASLDNYRTLYRTYRGDPVLQQVHERWPMIVIWDDHEFSDDSHGATATYFDGRTDEYDQERRRNAEQAFFEWVPIEVGLGDDGTLAIDDGTLYPTSRIYRDFQFGSLLHLVMTDYRTYRPDHLIPEDAFPGSVMLDEDTLEQVLGEATWQALRQSFDPYVNLEMLGLNILTQTATVIASQAYQMENPALGTSAALALARSRVRGNVSATYLNALFASAGLPAPFNAQAMQLMPRGLSYLYLGKTSLYSAGGSRYMVLNDTYNVLAGALYVATAGLAEDALGGQQQAWLNSVLGSSSSTWKVLASSVSMAPMVLDFTNPLIAAQLPPEFPDQLRTRLKLNVDGWDGFPHMRQELLQTLAAFGNSVVISGDIHATFVSDHGDGVFEFTGPAISSATFGSMVAGFVAADPILGDIEGLDVLIDQLAALLQLSATDDEMVSPSDIVYTTTDRHGYLIVDVTADALTATLQEYPESHTFTSYYDDPDALQDLFEATVFTVQDGQLVPGEP